MNQRKRLAFLALLASSGSRGIARERLLLLLWPESTTERARGALYQLLYVVRQAFGEGCVLGTDELRLDSTVVESDVDAFIDALDRGDLLAAVERHAGPFLDAFHVADAPELERWIEQKRQELARGYQSALARLVAQAMEHDDHATAVTFAERLVAADPLSARATVSLMEALAASGDVTSALERARLHASVVREELDADVDTSVSALAARLRSESAVAGVQLPHATPESIANRETLRAAATPAIVRRPKRSVAWATAAVVVLGSTAGLAMRHPRDRVPELVILADFKTALGDSQVADALTDATRRVLNESYSLRPAPDAGVLATRARLGIPATERLTLEAGRQVALGSGIANVVTGTLEHFDGAYMLSLRVVSAESGQTLVAAAKAGVTAMQLFETLDTLTRRLRSKAGDDREAVRKQPSLLALTSSSLQAMTDYTTALRLPRDSIPHAIALLREAVQLDSTFASALWRLGFFTEFIGPRADAEHRALLARAWRHRDRLTEYEQLRLEIAYKYSPNGIAADIEEHTKYLSRVVERYPNAVDAKILADLYLGKRNLAGAEREYRRTLDFDSTKRDAYLGLISTYLKANRIGDARRAMDDFPRRFPTSPSGDAFDVVVSYAGRQGDRVRALADRLLASAGPGRLIGSYVATGLDLLDGRATAAKRRLDEKDDSLQTPPTTTMPLPQCLTDYWTLQRPDQGLRMLEASLAAKPSLRFSLDAAELYAQLGRPDSARALLAARGKTDLTTYMKGADTLVASAWIDLAENRPREAVTKFRGSLRYFGGNAPSQILRDAEIGLAFERAGMPDSAIASYEHYLNAAPVWDLDIFKLPWVLDHAARLYDAKGDRRRARANYERFAALWANADPELQPRVTHARERLEALR